MPKRNRNQCSIEDCNRNAFGGGLCQKHYQRFRHHGTTDLLPRPTEAERFWGKVIIGGPDECWPWRTRFSRFGYGIFTIYPGEKTILAHRHAYKLVNGAIPDGMVVMHSCDNPPCCNPAHLSAGTIADNNRDAIAKGRASFEGLAVRWNRGKG